MFVLIYLMGGSGPVSRALPRVVCVSFVCFASAGVTEEQFFDEPVAGRQFVLS